MIQGAYIPNENPLKLKRFESRENLDVSLVKGFYEERQKTKTEDGFYLGYWEADLIKRSKQTEFLIQWLYSHQYLNDPDKKPEFLIARNSIIGKLLSLPFLGFKIDHPAFDDSGSFQIVKTNGAIIINQMESRIVPGNYFIHF